MNMDGRYHAAERRKMHENRGLKSADTTLLGNVRRRWERTNKINLTEIKLDVVELLNKPEYGRLTACCENSNADWGRQAVSDGPSQLRAVRSTWRRVMLSYSGNNSLSWEL